MAAGRPPRVASSQWEVGSHLVSVCCLPRTVPGAARRLRRCVCRVGQGPHAPLLEMRQLQIRLSQIGQGRNGTGVHPLKLARLGRAPREGSSLHIPEVKTALQLQILVTSCLSGPSFSSRHKFAQVRGRRVAEPPVTRARGSPLRQPRGAARRGSRGRTGQPLPLCDLLARWAPAARRRRPRGTTVEVEAVETPRTPGLPPRRLAAAIGSAAYSTPKRWTSMRHSYRTMRDWS